MIKAKKLRPGDTIAIISPSSDLAAIFPHRIQNAKTALEHYGFKVETFPTTKKSIKGSAGTIEERVRDIHDAFSDPRIKGIICSIGGLTAEELLGHIDYNLIRNNPKVFCGYSDISILHYAFAAKADLVTFYGPAAMTQFAEFPTPDQYVLDHFSRATGNVMPVGRVLASEHWTDQVLNWKNQLKIPRDQNRNRGYVWLQEGKAKGQIVGGCLPTILQLHGTQYDMDYSGKILFIETPEGDSIDTGYSLNKVRTNLDQLNNSGVFSKIKGLIIGRAFGYTPEEKQELNTLIQEYTSEQDYPVLVDANIGHADPVITLPLHVQVSIDSSNNYFSIDESGVVD